MNDNLSSAQFKTVGRKQITTDDLVSRGDSGVMRVRSVDHSNGFTSLFGVRHPSQEPMEPIHIWGHEKARRHAE